MLRIHLFGTPEVNIDEQPVWLRRRKSRALIYYLAAHQQPLSRESLLAGQEGKKVVEVPFVLEYTHLMMARGSLNGIQGLTAFVDSGLASEAKLTAPLQTLQYLNIPIPERTTTDPVGGGGGVWQSGFFEVESIELGELVQQAAQGEYGALPPEFYWSQGYIQDFLISHRFLRQYTTWTIDFDRMVYCFER